jgi:hypothetical protein
LPRLRQIAARSGEVRCRPDCAYTAEDHNSIAHSAIANGFSLFRMTVSMTNRHRVYVRSAQLPFQGNLNNPVRLMAVA